MSLGEDRVRKSFNPSESNLVDYFKSFSAKLIDDCHCESMRVEAASEARRLWHLAMTAYEEAAMWAVKAATWSV